jgi:hypothetical protein
MGDREREREREKMSGRGSKSMDKRDTLTMDAKKKWGRGRKTTRVAANRLTTEESPPKSLQKQMPQKRTWVRFLVVGCGLQFR